MQSLLKKNASVLAVMKPHDQVTGMPITWMPRTTVPSIPPKEMSLHRHDLATLRFSKISLSFHPNSSGTRCSCNGILIIFIYFDRFWIRTQVHDPWR